MTEVRWLTAEEVARALKVTRATVRRLLRAGHLRGSRLGTKAGWRVKEADLLAFMDGRANQPG